MTELAIERVAALDPALLDHCDFSFGASGWVYPFDSVFVLPRPERLLALVRLDGRVAGYVACRRDGDAGEVRRLEVDRAARGSGLGRLLLEEARRWAGEQGLAALVLETLADNPDAGRFFAHQGFALVREADALHWRLPLRD